jgi:hypothetical protein
LFHSSCEILDHLSAVFTSARAMAKLATDTMQEVERVAADRSKARRRHEVPDPTARHPPDGTEALSTAPREAYVQGNALQGGPSDETQGIEQSVEPTTAPSDAVGDLSWNDSPFMMDDYLGDAELFNDFDPSFDLDRIDQVFSANLDPTQPLPGQSWFDSLDPG